MPGAKVHYFSGETISKSSQRNNAVITWSRSVFTVLVQRKQNKSSFSLFSQARFYTTLCQ